MLPPTCLREEYSCKNWSFSTPPMLEGSLWPEVCLRENYSAVHRPLSTLSLDEHHGFLRGITIAGSFYTLHAARLGAGIHWRSHNSISEFMKEGWKIGVVGAIGVTGIALAILL